MARNQMVMDATPEVVFSVLADPDTYEYWVVGNKRVRRSDPEWPAQGSEFHHTVGFGPLATKDKTCVAEVDPPRRLVLMARAMPVGVAKVHFELEPDGSRTKVTMIEEPVRGPILRYANRLLDLLIHLRNTESLRRLRRVAEERAGTTTPSRPEGSVAT